jgi:hypothetical protein
LPAEERSISSFDQTFARLRSFVRAEVPVWLSMDAQSTKSCFAAVWSSNPAAARTLRRIGCDFVRHDIVVLIRFPRGACDAP